MSIQGFAQIAVATRVSNSGDHEVIYGVDFEGKVWRLDMGAPRAKWIELERHPHFVVDQRKAI